jgi:hypothetical protein
VFFPVPLALLLGYLVREKARPAWPALAWTARAVLLVVFVLAAADVVSDLQTLTA